MSSVKTIGIVGGGQLAQMLTLAAKPFGFATIVIDTTPNCPAAQVGAAEIITKVYDENVVRQLASKADIITVEFDEALDEPSLAYLETLPAQGKSVNPAPQTIRLIQDKLKQKQFLQTNHIPVGPFEEIKNVDQAKSLLKHFGGKMMIKTRRGGYDGHGNMVVKNNADVSKAFQHFGKAKLYAESFVPFKKELATMVARSITGQTALYPVVETIHVRNICSEVIAPAEVTATERKKAEQVAQAVAQHLQGAGMFGVEMFLTESGDVWVNEISPRVHNSGHLTIEACVTSQFEQHIRAITGMPLGGTDMKAPAAVMVNILGERNGETKITGLKAAEAIPDTFVHIYGKSLTKIDRKMGHITSTGKTVAEAQKRAQQARRAISI